MSKFTGIKTVEIEDSPGSFAGAEIDLGCPLASSPSLTQEPQAVEDAQGRNLYGGNKDSCEYHFADFTNFASLKADMEADTEKDIRITFMDDTTEVIFTAAIISVSKNYQATTGSRNYMILKATKYRVT